MSPEQAMGDREISARSDVYALGCVAYEMLVGEPPFTGPTAQAIIARVMTEEPRTLTLQRKTIPPGVEAAVFTALEKLPADRFATAAEFAAALANPTTTTARTSMQPVVVHQRRRELARRRCGRRGGIARGRPDRRPRRRTPAASGPDEVVRASLALGDSAVVRSIGNAAPRDLAFRPADRLRRGRRRRISSSGSGSSTSRRRARSRTPRARSHPFFSPDGESIGFFTHRRAAARR